MQSPDFQGYVVVDAMVGGRAVGGTRMTPGVTLDDVAGLANQMSLKLALAGLPIGGAKAGIRCALPEGERRDRALRDFGRWAAPLLRDGVYLGSDQGVTYRDRAILFEAAGFDESAISPRRPLPCSWGQLWEHLADITGHGVAEATSVAVSGEGRTVALQGFGIVGRGAAQELTQLGAIVVAVADRLGVVAAPGGLPLDLVLAATDAAGTIDRTALPDGLLLSGRPDAWLDVDADILVLAAGGGALHAGNADRVQASLVVEGANSPCTRDALRALAARGIPVLPGIVANCGSATVTALVLTDSLPGVDDAPDVASLTKYLFDRVGSQVRDTTREVIARANRSGVSWYEAAEDLARRRLPRASGPAPARSGPTRSAQTRSAQTRWQSQSQTERTSTMSSDTMPDLAHATVGKPSTRLSDPLPQAQDPGDFVDGLTNEVLTSAAANIGPFYERLIAGRIPLSGVQAWVKQWYVDSRMFPSVIGQIAANAGYFYDARQVMGANFAEELGEFNPLREHPVTVRQLARALGVSDEELEFTEPYPETLLYVEYRQHLVRDYHWLEGLAAGSFAIELTIPNRFRKIAAALSAQFGLDDEALEVFRIHAGDERLELDYGGDDKHAGEAQDLIRKYAVTAEMQHRVRLAMWRSIEARKVYQWGLFREICLKHDPLWSTIVAGSDAPAEQTV
ncbi:iron-containing redox enzyme family protein [Solihabitans fulvus]|uniref:iron-containing redox enzyme family protein n=1 Tax=Solihabitans fulvus TaxID=1892852 RepID=UPI0016619D9B|nr:iron-containing redox enzyme family protein [Solihabitans fulvus]